MNTNMGAISKFHGHRGMSVQRFTQWRRFIYVFVTVKFTSRDPIRGGMVGISNIKLG